MAIIKWNRPVWPSFIDEETWPSVFNWPDISESTGGVDIYETDDAVVVEAQVPGVKEENVEVTIEGNILTISATVQTTEEEKNKRKTIYKSTRQGSFNYSTSLPRIVDASRAEAEVSDGVVKVSVPKVEEEKPKKIVVKKVK